MFTKDAYYNGGRARVPPELEAAIKASRASEDIELRRKAFSTVQRLVMENAFCGAARVPVRTGRREQEGARLQAESAGQAEIRRRLAGELKQELKNGANEVRSGSSAAACCRRCP